MAFVNLTPHPIVIVDGPTVPPSGTVARVTSSSINVRIIDGVAFSRVSFGEVVGLPDPVPGDTFIVSAMVRSAVPHRDDVASPGDLVRDDAGNVIGCRGLIVN
jgi:hypothetical protein